jgi:BMFP domain-containing protein YqiC
MRITPDQCLAEAANMALELRLKDRALAQYEQENAALRTRVADLESRLGEEQPHDHEPVPAQTPS